MTKKDNKHWLEQILDKYDIESRYELAQRGGPSEDLASKTINRRSKFENISIKTIHQIILAIQDKYPSLDYNDLLVEIWSKNMPE